MRDEKHLPEDQVRDGLMESLLESALQPADHADRIANAMEALDREQVSLSPAITMGPRFRLSPSTAALLAATLVLALLVVFDPLGVSQSAMATVERSLHVAAESMTRKYSLTVKHRWDDSNTKEFENELFVRGSDHFALRHPGIVPGTSFWLGSNGVEAWVVPAMGPVHKGGPAVVHRWLESKPDVETPFLHLTNVLAKMSEGYRLVTLPDEALVLRSGEAKICQRIHAERKTDADAAQPDVIDLWASRDSGMALQVVAQWSPNDRQPSRESVTLSYLNDEPSLGSEWYVAESHYQGSRVIKRDLSRSGDHDETGGK